MPDLKEKGFGQTRPPGRGELDSAVVEVVSPAVERPERGPFDVIGDIHGCSEELVALLIRLGYRRDGEAFAHPEGRQAIFLGDLPNRGPDTPGVLATVTAMVARGTALYTPGNQCVKLYRALRGEIASPKPALATTIEKIDALPPGPRKTIVREFFVLFRSAPPYFVLDEGRLVVAHAGIEESMIGKTSEDVVHFVREGDVVGRTPEGRPIRRDWGATYRGAALVVYGHTPRARAEFVNNTINIDQGCVYGGALSALRYPERQVVSVPARRAYWPVGRGKDRPVDTDPT
jgi:diadenosine tetraphosphatase ApaH/serine/threonine PP2A family protein phosphatase